MKLKKFIPEIVIGAIIICAFLLIGRMLLDLRDQDKRENYIEQKHSELK